MKFTVKTLNGSRFDVDVDPSTKVVDVKETIERAKPELSATNMKLIHSGRILKDDATIEASCTVKPNRVPVLVALTTKAKRVATAHAPVPTDQQTAAEEGGSTGSTSAATVSSAAADPGGQDEVVALQALRNHPRLNMLRHVAQSNPRMLQVVLAQIGEQSPELLEEINSNQELFLEMMNEPPTSALDDLETHMGELGELAQLREIRQLMAELQDMIQELRIHVQGGGLFQLTDEEAAAVDRLAGLGFDRTEAAQAFLACDKNEMLAANLLMDSALQEHTAFGGVGRSGGDSSDRPAGE